MSAADKQQNAQPQSQQQPAPPPQPPPSTLLQSDDARRLTLPRSFQNEIRNMMYGFGDNINPRPDTVRLMEELVIDYITTLASKSTEIAHRHRRERPDVQDIKLVIRKDPVKLERVRYLLEMKVEIRKATNVVTDDVGVEMP